MATSSIECNICNKDFNETSHCPRNLPCGHHLCTPCIDKLIASKTRTCPFCRKGFEASSSSELMVNFGIQECIKIMSSQKLMSKKNTKASSAFQSKILAFKEEATKTTADVMDDLEELKRDTEKLLTFSEELEEDFGTEMTDLAENLMPQIQNVLTKIKDDSKVLERSSLKLKNRLKDVEKKGKILSSAKGLLDSATSLEDTAAVVDEVEDTNTAFAEWADNLKQFLRDEEAKIQKARKDIAVSRRMKHDLNEALKSRPEDESFLPIPVTGAVAEKMEVMCQVTPMGLWEMSTMVRRLIERGRLFALHLIGEQRKSAKITIENGKLHLYSLEDEVDPLPKSYYLSYEDVRRLAMPPYLVFMDLSAKGSSLGRIVISMKDNQPLDYLPFHSTGGRGKSYLKMPLQVTNRGQPWERVILGRPMAEAQNGDWTAYNLNGPNAMFHDCGSLYVVNNGVIPPIIAFNTGPYSGNFAMVGDVVEGLQVVRDALRHVPEAKEITVSACGMILSTEKPIEIL